MLSPGFGAGLVPGFSSPPPGKMEHVVTDEAAMQAPWGHALRVIPLIEEGEDVAQGAPLLRLRDAPEICIVAPMPSRVARMKLRPGRVLSETVLFRQESGDVVRHDTAKSETPDGLRSLLQKAGFWPMIRRRPFGGMPPSGETPAGIFVMSADTRPLALDPIERLKDREAHLGRGIRAVTQLTDGPVYLCIRRGGRLPLTSDLDGRVVVVACEDRHPHGLAGLQIHKHLPARVNAPVWDIDIECVACLGEFLETGILPQTRTVRIAGDGLRIGRTVRTQFGADLRELTQRAVKPEPHLLLSGSPLDGHEAQWLATHHRQVTVATRRETRPPPHWLVSALTRSARAKPVIPTAALDHALGGMIPAAAFIRALSSGDEETAVKLGVLALLEEDLALADYAVGGDSELRIMLRNMLNHIRAEQGT